MKSVKAVKRWKFSFTLRVNDDTGWGFYWYWRKYNGLTLDCGLLGVALNIKIWGEAQVSEFNSGSSVNV